VAPPSARRSTPAARGRQRSTETTTACPAANASRAPAAHSSSLPPQALSLMVEKNPSLMIAGPRYTSCGEGVVPFPRRGWSVALLLVAGPAMKQDLAFAFVVESGDLESKAVLLARSIRR